MPRPSPGEVCRVDLGLAAKVRPCLILSDYPADDELALVVVVPHTTSVRGNRWELAIPKPFLESGVFHRTIPGWACWKLPRSCCRLPYLV